MISAIANLQEKIDARNLRERALIFVTLLAVVFMLWQLLFQSGVDKQRTLLNGQVNDLTTQRQAVEAQIAAITQALATDPYLEEKNRMAQLQSEIADLDAQLGSLSQGLVSADELPRVLQEMLAKTASLHLLHVQTLPVRELPLIAAEAAEDDGEASSAGVFKHGVILRVSGSYFQLLEFLQQLETAERRFYWEQLDYRVTRYPNAEILLRVYTLGAERGRLGV